MVPLIIFLNFYRFILVYFIILFDNFSTYFSAVLFLLDFILSHHDIKKLQLELPDLVSGTICIIKIIHNDTNAHHEAR